MQDDSVLLHYPGSIKDAIRVARGGPQRPEDGPRELVFPSNFKKLTNAKGAEVTAVIYRVDPPLAQESNDYVRITCTIDGVEIDSIEINKANRNSPFEFYISQNQLEIKPEYDISYLLHRKNGESEAPKKVLRVIKSV
ncbi:hypothetical protein EVS84_19230 [Pseudomonas koreensis]|uniref:Uncharacterized protein n=2 Tax=Pseudomonas TaxID=286 RepID=A0A4Q4L114_9PSED|nr:MULTISPECIES: hypothetical protein [Pseudomonas]KIF55603.1 hypothetical protein NX10_25255 [Pseudomonas fluorescens]MDM8194167.1 hypothetical protein [Pseudomonas fluorescens]MDP8575412.1 hypothetical protein [Pseudomonas iranensis]RYM39682.1 hypothetical protein EVS84_19230 [Pseudomonas koreensis]